MLQSFAKTFVSIVVALALTVTPCMSAASSRLPMPNYQAINGSGVPYPGAKLYFYTANTVTLSNTYSDAALSVPNTNPVVADADGRFPTIFLGSGTYDVVCTDTNGASIWEEDDVAVPGVSTASTTTAGAIEIATTSEALAGTSTSLAMTPATSAAAIQQGFTYAAAGGTANAITATLAPATTAYAAGMRVPVRIGTTNTGAVTLNVNGLGAIAVKKVGVQGVAALEANDLISTVVYDFVYDAASGFFWVQAPLATNPVLGPMPVTAQADSNYTLTQADRGKLNVSTITADRTGTLPAASAVPNGTVFAFSLAPGSTQGKKLTITRAGSDTIDGLTARPIYRAQVVMVVSDGTSVWRSISGKYSFVSADTAATAAGTLVTLAHGLSTVPRKVTVWLVCTSTDNGWAVGDTLLKVSTQESTAGGTNNMGQAIYADATNVYIQAGSDAAYLRGHNKSTGATVALTIAKWSWRVEAEE